MSSGLYSPTSDNICVAVRAGVNSAPELEFIANSGIELELPSLELELNWNSHNWNWNLS